MAQKARALFGVRALDGNGAALLRSVIPLVATHTIWLYIDVWWWLLLLLLLLIAHCVCVWVISLCHESDIVDCGCVRFQHQEAHAERMETTVGH